MRRAAAQAASSNESTGQSTSARRFESQRPPQHLRNFSSPAVEAKIAQVTATLKDPELAWLFANCFPNTLDTATGFTREWFAWANTLFGEFVLQVLDKRPHLISR